MQMFAVNRIFFLILIFHCCFFSSRVTSSLLAWMPQLLTRSLIMFSFLSHKVLRKFHCSGQQKKNEFNGFLYSFFSFRTFTNRLQFTNKVNWWSGYTLAVTLHNGGFPCSRVSPTPSLTIHPFNRAGWFSCQLFWHLQSNSRIGGLSIDYLIPILLFICNSDCYWWSGMDKC